MPFFTISLALSAAKSPHFSLKRPDRQDRGKSSDSSVRPSTVLRTLSVCRFCIDQVDVQLDGASQLPALNATRLHRYIQRSSGLEMLFSRFTVFQIAICLLLVAVAMPSTAEAQRGGDGESENISFTKEVAPIINAKCGRCHVASSRGRYNIKSYKALMDSDSVTARKPDRSSFIELIENGDMPKGGLKVTDDELETLRQWITEGAKFDGDDESQMISAGGNSRNSRSRGQSGRGQSSRGQSGRGRSSQPSGRAQGRSSSRSRGSSRSSKPNPIEANKLLAFFDRDGDGKLSLEEIDAASRMLRSLDANGDKRVTGDELEEIGDR